jgi:uncharacterized phage-associated protein
MDADPPFDPRGIANLLLDCAAQYEIALTNLALQKLLYFTHGVFLTRKKVPLVSGYFEAWEFGPVHPIAYQAFKPAGGTAISFRATSKDLITGKLSIVPSPSNREIIQHIESVITTFGHMAAGRLVELSHAKDAPWEHTMNKEKTALAFGRRISNNVIIQRFKFHKTSIGALPAYGENFEETPPC